MPLRIARRSSGAGCQLSLSGVVTALDLRRGLLALVREGGWAEPALWDFREGTDCRVSHNDLVDTDELIRQFMGHLPPRGRTALVVSTVPGRAAAMDYRELQPPDARADIAVFNTLEAGDAWLDSDQRDAPTQPRALRVGIRSAFGSLGGDACQIVNISHSGALLLAPHAVSAGRECILALRQDPLNADIRVRVVRSHQKEPNEEWHVAVTFVSPQEALEQIDRLVSAQRL